MGGTYQAGEEKVRPGVYRRYSTEDKKLVAGAMTGVFAIPVKADFGPVGVVTIHTEQDTLKEMYGVGGTVKGATNLFEGGAAKVHVYRLGTGGTKGTLDLKDAEDAAVVSLETKYPTDITFAVSLKQKLGSETKREFSVYQGAVLKEKFEYEVQADGDEGQILTEIINAKSAVFHAEKAAEDKKPVSVVQQEITPGTNPTVTNAEYSAALEAFEAYKWNVLVTDTVDTAVHELLKAYMKRLKNNGSIGSCVVGEGSDVAFEERMEHAKSFDSEYFIYAGSGYVDAEGNKVDGYEAVTIQAGIIGSTPSNKSVVHTVIPNAVDTLEVLKNEDYIHAIENGMLLLSPSEEGEVWFDSGVNTLTTLNENQDAGWKKIRRTMTRYEMFDRIDRTITPLVGKVNCDSDGISNVVKVAQDVLIAMVNEGKLMDGANFYEDPEQAHGPDNAHFIIEASDIDSLEKIYLNYKFSFSGE